jgi:hypothetical protein
MTRIVALGVLFAALLAGTAHAAPMRVVVIPTPTNARNFEPNFAALERLSKVGAIGILVPDAGPETSRERALAALRRGAVRNSLLDDAPPGEPLIGEPAFGAYRPNGPTIVLSLPPAGMRSNDLRYAIAVIAPGYRGVLTSESTRIPGLVSIADVAPTALGREGRLASTPSENALMTVYDLDMQIDRHRGGKTPYFLVSLAVIAFFAAFWRRGVLAAVAAVLLGNLVLGMTEYTHATAFFWLLVLAFGAVLYAFLRPLAQGFLCAGVVAAYLAALAADERWVALSPLGPTQNARFYGLSNLLATLLLIPALAGAAILRRRFGLWAFAAVAGLSLVAVGGSQFGADGGGVIVLLVGFAVLLVLEGWLSRQAVLAAAGMLAVLAVALVTGGESHVTDAIGDGPAGLAEDLARRLELSWLRASAGWGVGLLVAGGILALIAAALRDRRPLILAYLAAIAVSLVVNDSPNDVIVAGLAGYLALSTAPGVARRAGERATPAVPEPRARSAPAASP